MMPAGRPTKLTPELQARMLALLRAGNYVETAAAACGLAKKTFYNWLQKGARAKGGEYHEFAAAVEKAMGEAEARDLLTIDKAAQGYDVTVVKETVSNGVVIDREVKNSRRFDWQAAAWRLERKFPDRWGRRERVEHSGPGGKPIQSETKDTKVLIYIPDNGRGDGNSSQ